VLIGRSSSSNIFPLPRLIKRNVAGTANATNATITIPIVSGDQNPLSTVGLLVGLYEGKFHGISVGEGAGEADGLGEGEGVVVAGGKVGILGNPCAFVTGAVATAEVNMVRTNSASISLAKSFFKPIEDFSNINLPNNNGSLADLTLCQENRNSSKSVVSNFLN
jgi:hypothetical protein